MSRRPRSRTGSPPTVRMVPAVHVWLTRQDAVFQACHDDGVVLPGAGQGGPDWLQADEAYQAAALALYEGTQSRRRDPLRGDRERRQVAMASAKAFISRRAR